MVIKLRLSPRARKDIKKIYTWYKQEANEKVAANITDDIKAAIKSLATHPNLGYIEPDLESFPQSFRTYVLVPNHKIIYWLDDDFVKIATVFDCRQKPKELVYIINTKTDWICDPPAEYNEKPTL